MNHYGRYAALVSLALLGACAHLKSFLPIGSPAERLARGVTIVRDEWGVPHVLAPTDAQAAFGLAYAQAEDGWWHIEENYIRALGRASNWYGDRFLAADLARRAIEVERRARETYERQTPEQRAFWDAYAAGLNYYILTAGVRTRLIRVVEPWMPFALELADIADLVIDTATGGPPLAAIAAVRPDGAVLVENARGEFTGVRPRHEAMVLSDEGWHVRGFTRPGSPAFVSGHNAHIAWTSSTWIDRADLVVDSAGATPLVGITEWHDTLRVNTKNGVVTREFTFRRTAEGPIVTALDGRTFVVNDDLLRVGALHGVSGARGLETLRVVAAPTRCLLYASVDRHIALLLGDSVVVDDVLAVGVAVPDTMRTLAEIAFDTRIPDTEAAINTLAGEWEAIGGFDAARARRLDAAIDVLRSWDGRATTDSEAATLYVLWQERMRTYGYEGEHANFRAMEQIIAQLERDWNRVLVPWGDVNRLVHTESYATPPGLPIGGAPAWTGIMLAVEPQVGAPTNARIGERGTMSILAVELTPTIRAQSVVPLSQSGDSTKASPPDQAPLFTAGKLKPAWFTRADVLANGRRSYRPGDPAHIVR